MSTEPTTSAKIEAGDPFARLDQESDEALNILIISAKAELAKRQKAREREALKQIKAIAKEHGLSVRLNAKSQK